MPKQTFLNLPEERQKTFIDTALREFTVNNYDDASISSVLKELGMAKGSFYQYFENKRDLFDYLMKISFETKTKYVLSVKRENYDNFWDYTIAMYEHGLGFDRNHPRMSNFAYCLTENLNSPTVRELFISWQHQGMEIIKSIVKAEMDSGHFRDDIPLNAAAMFFMNLGKQLLERIRMENYEDFNQRISDGRPLLADGNEPLLFAILDENILLMRAALDKKAKK